MYINLYNNFAIEKLIYLILLILIIADKPLFFFTILMIYILITKIYYL